jgi:hypothetical protein
MTRAGLKRGHDVPGQERWPPYPAGSGGIAVERPNLAGADRAAINRNGTESLGPSRSNDGDRAATSHPSARSRHLQSGRHSRHIRRLVKLPKEMSPASHARTGRSAIGGRRPWNRSLGRQLKSDHRSRGDGQPGRPTWCGNHQFPRPAAAGQRVSARPLPVAAPTSQQGRGRYRRRAS